MEQIKINPSSVEWLQWALEHTILTHEQTMQTIGLFEQAKEMHKEEIIEAVYDSMGTNFDPSMGRAELYYKKKYENARHK